MGIKSFRVYLIKVEQLRNQLDNNLEVLQVLLKNQLDNHLEGPLEANIKIIQ